MAKKTASTKAATARTGKRVPISSAADAAITFRCRGRSSPRAQAEIARLLAAGKREEAALHDRATREGCGEDLTALLAALPQDGESHAFDCPRCGLAHHATRTPPDDAAVVLEQTRAANPTTNLRRS